MNKNDIKDLMKFFSESGNISRLKVKQKDMELLIEKETYAKAICKEDPVLSAISAPLEIPSVSVVPAIKQPDGPCITSPMVGTFYQAPAPGAKAFVKVGDTVSKGQTVAIIEAMKIMNEIEAEYDCKIVKFLVEDGQPVEFDMPIYEVEKL